MFKCCQVIECLIVVYVYKTPRDGVVVVWSYPERSTQPVLLFSAVAVAVEVMVVVVVGKVLTVWEVKRRKEGRRGGQLGRNSDYF